MSDSRSKPQVSCLSLMTMTWLRGGLTPDWRAPGAVKCVRDLQMSNMSEKKGKNAFWCGQSKEAWDGYWSTYCRMNIALMELSTKISGEVSFHQAPAPWEVFNVLFSSACSAAVNLIFLWCIIFQSFHAPEKSGIWRRDRTVTLLGHETCRRWLMP